MESYIFEAEKTKINKKKKNEVYMKFWTFKIMKTWRLQPDVFDDP
jgi:hypothetical protein